MTVTRVRGDAEVAPRDMDQLPVELREINGPAASRPPRCGSSSLISKLATESRFAPHEWTATERRRLAGRSDRRAETLARSAVRTVPGGARWRYVWGSTLVVAFVTQSVTGIFLWMAYSPSTQTAWESVYYIQHEMTGGWLLRGIHHFMAQAMVVLLASICASGDRRGLSRAAGD